VALCEALRDALVEARTDPGVSVFVLGSTDSSCFSAGMDTKEALRPEATTMDVLLDVQWALESFPKPFVAIVGGHVIGGGAELALSADIRIGSPSTVFRFPGTGYGLAQGSWHLADAIGQSWARELVLTGRPVGAEECLRLGLLHEIHDDPEPPGLALARAVAERSDVAIQESKRMIMAAAGRPQRERFEEEQWVNARFMAEGEVGARIGTRDKRPA